ncbi:hypothetical protein [Desertibacillus haloalkaliphilus]|uniref:hypothetical protein n=1 Tax=Desertibacillus haloalkaliphilus TaxID=1328930 RepID=UPI001C261C30|nr:hypothetical protein [Desertibacillus haloalkaliphilus]MBU8908518.1 hypothetical protein [Desertibacillus haloalkaliphilus]
MSAEKKVVRIDGDNVIVAISKTDGINYTAHASFEGTETFSVSTHKDKETAMNLSVQKLVDGHSREIEDLI